MNQNVYLNKQSRNLNTSPIPGGININKIKSQEVNKQPENTSKNMVDLEPAPEVEFCSDRRKRIARNVQKVFGFSHGGTPKKKKKKR